ncbi:cyanophycinase [Pontixanthobacter aestiaquae]|uniref:Cyanophycinase n=1 Tax=Pontixanthobacter aestiaquae TaxID=1509367 RepID=A0A844Z2P1_9SPHN|nr:cyanophycinase [Pontixanthobacter aestiaquae]MDN3647270.1 cyanophycinase [Pontixanthobacter aestiaquae]MXO81754.1 cyanophycinase [Pontixanthobacter aestiaquae]
MGQSFTKAGRLLAVTIGLALALTSATAAPADAHEMAQNDTRANAQAKAGQLIIVGGGLDPTNAAIFKALLDARPAGKKTVAIIPAASGSPAGSAKRFAENLQRHGLDEDNIVTIRLAVKDDPNTRGVDESRWAGNAGRKSEIAKLEEAGAIWFTGGDQARIVQSLLNSDGSETPMLAAIHHHHATGTAIGGTSAGAAMMSTMMLLQGDTPGALLPDGSGEKLALGRGLGFFRHGLVDQHFGERARLGRLALALGMIPAVKRIGFGIDEDTAFIIDHATMRGTVAGSGYVTILDARSARFDIGKRIGISGLTVGIASSGDSVNLSLSSISSADYKRSVIGREYFDRPQVVGGGMAVSGTSLAEVIGEGLVDNKAADSTEKLSFISEYGLNYQFGQTDKSQGWWGRDASGTARYTVTNVAFDIVPVRVTVKKEITQ